MTNQPVFLVVGVIAALAAIALLAALLPKSRSRLRLSARVPLTEREQAMYFRLIEGAPQLIVLAQVSMGALVTAKNKASWNVVSQKTVDFVLCTRAFEVVAVVELDDASHRTKRAADTRRDALLTSVGIRTLRYRNIPDIGTLRADLLPPSDENPA